MHNQFSKFTCDFKEAENVKNKIRTYFTIHMNKSKLLLIVDDGQDKTTFM